MKEGEGQRHKTPQSLSFMSVFALVPGKLVLERVDPFPVCVCVCVWGSDMRLSNSAISSQQLVGTQRRTVKQLRPSPSSWLTPVILKTLSSSGQSVSLPAARSSRCFL